jgi:hypothetical protein
MPVRNQIREIFMANGFTIKEGQEDLKEYVYSAAIELINFVANSCWPEVIHDADRYRRIRSANDINVYVNSIGDGRPSNGYALDDKIDRLIIRDNARK